MAREIAKALALLSRQRGYPYDEAIDRATLVAFVAQRPGVALAEEIQRWIARVDGDGLRRPRHALAGWLRVALDSQAEAEEEVSSPHVVTPDHILERLPGPERDAIRSREQQRLVSA